STSNLCSHVINIYKINISSIIDPEELAALFPQSGKHLLRETLVK
ncbi:5164_t:CDS:1, partial [Racocetra persica]